MVMHGREWSYMVIHWSDKKIVPFGSSDAVLTEGSLDTCIFPSVSGIDEFHRF